MKSATAGLIGLAIAAASVEGRLHKQHARGLRPHTHHIKRADNVQRECVGLGSSILCVLNVIHVTAGVAWVAVQTVTHCCISRSLN